MAALKRALLRAVEVTLLGLFIAESLALNNYSGLAQQAEFSHQAVLSSFVFELYCLLLSLQGLLDTGDVTAWRMIMETWLGCRCKTQLAFHSKLTLARKTPQSSFIEHTFPKLRLMR